MPTSSADTLLAFEVGDIVTFSMPVTYTYPDLLDIKLIVDRIITFGDDAGNDLHVFICVDISGIQWSLSAHQIEKI